MLIQRASYPSASRAGTDGEWSAEGNRSDCFFTNG